ncbi:MAG: NAD-dependent dehydratase [Candidatus Marinimicrobia bacterium]|nr:NAD-dependent dehydratase [Candidatus Neomarinimicrobiota bacterium]
MKNMVFGTGPLAWWVMQELLEKGDSVALASRSGKINKPLPKKVQIHACDATQPDEVAKLCQDMDAVYFCAMPPYTNWPDLFPPLVVGFLKGLARTQAKIIFGDNLYLYGPTQGTPLSETVSHDASGHKGRTREFVARQFMAAHEREDNLVTIGRASDFYGPHTINAVFGEMFFKPALAGKTVNLLGNIDLPHTFSYIKDFAKGLVTLGSHEAAFGEAWHTPNAPTISTRDMLKLVEAELNGKIKVRVAGKTMISMMGLFNPMIKEVKEMMYTWEEPYVVNHSKFEAAFGAEPTSHEVAIKETFAWFKNYLEEKS